ncbi:MAG: hypothetical protein HGB03_01635 [Candidatus Yonathbacteria bacterium]|nr:hypothetical protein [Candidatus Yonathbacteria bacterium]NTW47965.1 hypothetical protein [Candidatus Yonathbacteria bacterium]
MKKRCVLVILYNLPRKKDSRVEDFIHSAKTSPPSNITQMTICDVSNETLFPLARKIKGGNFSEVRVLYGNHADYLHDSPALKIVFFERIERVHLCILNDTRNGWDTAESSTLPPL